MLPRVLKWQAEYADSKKPYLCSDAQYDIDLRIEFLVYVLQRCSLWNNIYETKDSFALVQNPNPLSSIIHVISNWLSLDEGSGFNNEHTFQVWKSCFKFQYESCILASFEVLKLLWNSEDDVAIGPIRQDVRGYCWRILNTRSEVAPISQGAVAWLTKAWNSVSGRFGADMDHSYGGNL
jgi:hypothetical protein